MLFSNSDDKALVDTIINFCHGVAWKLVGGLRSLCVNCLSLHALSSDQVLKLELKEIREQQDLLFRFMNFLKQEGAVHVLQFCLAVGKHVSSYHGCFYLHKIQVLLKKIQMLNAF